MPQPVPPAVDPAAAKRSILEYCQRKGALVAGAADLEASARPAPAGPRPADTLPRVRAVFALGGAARPPRPGPPLDPRPPFAPAV